jgi:prephenate dehydrogenase
VRPDTLGIIGLGAIGGSVAIAAARARIPRIVGYAATPAHGAAALKAGAITELATGATRVAEAADLLVLATPPVAGLELLAELAPVLTRRNIWCTDTASVKLPYKELAQRLGLARFAGSHPFAGTHRTGFAAARLGMFERAVVYVCGAKTGDEAAVEVAHFWEDVCGAAPVVIDAERHDRVLAWTSHLPQATASALAIALARQAPRGATFGTGAADTTRLAASSGEMWRDVLLLNRAALLETLDGLETALGDLRRALETADHRALATWLEEGAAWRRRIDQ